jgi:serine/threonine-protein kinase
MARVRLIDPMTTVKIITQCAKGLMKAHAVGIVHRDLKPENIHLTRTEDGEEIAKILDFGLAKFYAPVRTDEKTARLTREGAVFGTPAYMSPEQVKGQGSVDHRADLWALGCMAFECLTGRPVWNTDQGVAMTFAAIAAATPPVPSKLRPDLPPSFDEWFKKALERDVNKRFQNAKELADALARAFNAPHISYVAVNQQGELDLESIARDAEEVPSESVQLLESEKPPPSRSSSSRHHDSQTEIDRRIPSRPIGPSATDLPPTAAPPDLPPTIPPPRGGVGRYIVPLLAAGVAVAGGYLAWTKVIHPTPNPPTPSASTAASVPPSAASSSAIPVPHPPATPEDPKWLPTLTEGQRLLTTGDADGALRKFKEAHDQGGGLFAKTFLEQVKIGMATPGPCKLTAFSHPRMGYGGNLGRPAVAVTSQGAIVAWTDDHEQGGHDHAYSVLIDAAGRPTSKPRDLTPEGDFVLRPALQAVEDKVVLYYWDKSGREPGVRARWLDTDGRIAGNSILVSQPKAGMYWPTLDRASDGFWMAWQEDRDREGDDLFLRRLNNDLVPVGPEIRASDYVFEKGKGAQVRLPSVAVAQNGTVFVGYTLEREKSKLIQRMMISPAELEKGLDEKAPTVPVPGGGKEKPKDRELGKVTLVNEDKADGDYPAMACGKDGCFIVWHGVKGGAHAAFIDPTQGLVVWRKNFSPKGGHPALGVSADGQVEVVFFEQGKVRIASLSRDGVGVTSTFGRVTTDQPRPWIAPGKSKGEWYVAWLDVEGGKTEAYVARLACRN